MVSKHVETGYKLLTAAKIVCKDGIFTIVCIKVIFKIISGNSNLIIIIIIIMTIIIIIVLSSLLLYSALHVYMYEYNR